MSDKKSVMTCAMPTEDAREQLSGAISSQSWLRAQNQHLWMSKAIAIAAKVAATQHATIRILVGGDNLTIEHIILNRDAQRPMVKLIIISQYAIMGPSLGFESTGVPEKIQTETTLAMIAASAVAAHTSSHHQRRCIILYQSRQEVTTIVHI